MIPPAEVIDCLCGVHRNATATISTMTAITARVAACPGDNLEETA
jgi:hypothetical protein